MEKEQRRAMWRAYPRFGLWDRMYVSSAPLGLALVFIERRIGLFVLVVGIPVLYVLKQRELRTMEPEAMGQELAFHPQEPNELGTPGVESPVEGRVPDAPAAEGSTLEGAYRRRRYWRMAWRYGTIGVALAGASAVGDGDFEKGTAAFFPVVFGSLFLNWSLFARVQPTRWLGIAGFGAVIGITTALVTELSPIFDWAVAILAGGALSLGRLWLDNKVPNPIYWYTLTEPGDQV